MDWNIPNTDTYILTGLDYLLYALNEILRWSVDNVRTWGLILLILSWLKIQALKTKTVLDDKILSYLEQTFSFSWISKAIDWIRNCRKGAPLLPNKPPTPQS